MAYRIEYGPTKHKDKKPVKVGRKAAIFALLAALVIGLRFSGLGERIGRWLLPGDKEVTAAAFESMTERIETGENVGDAFACFCREIIENADAAE